MMCGHSLSDVLTEVRANQLKLDACKEHDFAPLTPGLFGTKWVCSRCQGQVDGLTVRWYLVGREHERNRNER